MKNRFNWFIACIITVTLLLCVAGCQDFLIQGTPGNTIININLDLSKLIKNARNDESQINGYVLKLFVYDAQNYKDGDREIENLPLITQTSNKVDVNGIVKASLEVEIDKTVIFVGKLFTLNEDNVESDKPLYAGKSEAFKVQSKDNKVHLVLSREKSEIGFEIELAETHTHTFAEEWSASLSHHWKGTTCGHNDVMADFTEHSFSDWTTTQQPTEEVAGSKERTCSVCKYKEVVEIANLSHTHTFAEEWSTSLTHHWKGTTCGHNDVMADFTKHSFSDWTTQQPTEEDSGSKERICSVCKYKEIVEIAQLAHTHKFATGWSHDAANHWKAATCEHTGEVSEKAAHTFDDWKTTTYATEDAVGSKERTCEECNYKETAVIEQLAHTHKFADSWSTSLTHHWKEADCDHKDIVSDFGEHTFGEWQRIKEPEIGVDGTKERYCIDCNYNEIDVIAKIPENFVFIQGDTITGATPTWLEPVDDQYKGVFIDGRTVILSDFYMGKYEVTQEEYASVMAGQKVMVNGTEYELESNPNYCTADSASYTLFDGEEQGKRPVEGVTWYDAVWYCNALSVKEGLSPVYNIEVTKVANASEKTGYYIEEATVTLNGNATGYRLPTVAEWEYAARGGDTEADDWNYVFSGADKVNGTTYADKNNSGLDSVGWYCYNNITGETGDSDVTGDVSGKGTHQVGRKNPNRLGIYDMSGNVREWCYDWKGDVNIGIESDPTGASSGTSRVSRGGGWNYYAYGTTVTRPSNFNPNNRDSTIGFRVVRPQF